MAEKWSLFLEQQDFGAGGLQISEKEAKWYNY
jgi:hypothetical protein